jgi:hypothetical protein
MAFGLGVLVTVIMLASIFSGLETFDGLSGPKIDTKPPFLTFGMYAAICLVPS